MNRKAFRQLLKKYLDDSCTSEERKIVDHWYDLVGKDYTPLSSEKLDEIEDRLWAKVKGSITGHIPNIYPKKSIIIRWQYILAAIFVGIILIGSLLFYNNKQVIPTESIVSAKANEGYLNETNSTKNPKKIQLEDGSVVIISPGSKLAYPRHFSRTRREVYLEGEAFFTVSKSPGRPFYVYSNQIVTQVLGTSFGISNKQGQLEVAVKSGKVAVYENGEQLKIERRYHYAQSESNLLPTGATFYYIGRRPTCTCFEGTGRAKK
jgi:hypothetical protein